MMLTRRGILRCLTGIIAAPAVVKIDSLMKVVAPKPLIGFGNDYEKYTCYFRMEPVIVSKDWRYVAKIANIPHLPGLADLPNGSDRLAALPAAPQHGAEGGIAAGQLRFG